MFAFNLEAFWVEQSVCFFCSLKKYGAYTGGPREIISAYWCGTYATNRQLCRSPLARFWGFVFDLSVRLCVRGRRDSPTGSPSTLVCTSSRIKRNLSLHVDRRMCRQRMMHGRCSQCASDAAATAGGCYASILHAVSVQKHYRRSFDIRRLKAPYVDDNLQVTCDLSRKIPHWYVRPANVTWAVFWLYWNCASGTLYNTVLLNSSAVTVRHFY